MPELLDLPPSPLPELRVFFMQRITRQTQVGFEFAEAWLMRVKNAGREQVA